MGYVPLRFTSPLRMHLAGYKTYPALANDKIILGTYVYRERTYFEMEPNTRVFMMREKRLAMEHLSTLMDLDMKVCTVIFFKVFN